MDVRKQKERVIGVGQVSDCFPVVDQSHTFDHEHLQDLDEKRMVWQNLGRYDAEEKWRT